MPWFYVDDMFADSKPVMALDRSLRNEAIGLWVRCGAWSAKEETDGRVPLDTVKSFDGTPRLIRALHQQAGLWGVENPEISPESWRDSREILFKSWEKWQKTRAENVAKREADAARQSNYRKSKKGRNYVADKPSSSGIPDLSQRDMPDTWDDPSKFVSRRESQRPDPDPTRPDPSLLVTYGGEGASVDASEPPRPHCPKHSENSDEPCPKCAARRRWDAVHPEFFVQDQLETKRRRREERENCPRCEGTSTYTDSQGTHPCRPHLPAVPPRKAIPDA